MPFGLTYGPTLPPMLDGEQQQPDPFSEVEKLIASYERPAAPQQPTVGPLRNIAGSIGDALSAMAAVRAGGAPPQIGSFRATMLGRQQAFEEQQADAADEERKLRNSLLIKKYEADREADRQALVQPGVRVSFESVLADQDKVDRGIVPSFAKGRNVKIKITTDEKTGAKIGEEFVGIVAPGEPNVRTWASTVSPEHAKTWPYLRHVIGQRIQFQATANPETGVLGEPTPLGPADEPFRLVQTPDGYARVTQEGAEPVLDPDGEQLKSWQQELATMRMDTERSVFERGRELEGGMVIDVANLSSSIGGVQRALSRYVELGEPQFWTGNQLVTSREAKLARAAVAGVLSEIRKQLSGSAVTLPEAEFAKDLIAKLDSFVTSDTLKSGLTELANMLWRKRVSILDTASKAGRSVANFQEEIRPAVFDNVMSVIRSSPTYLQGADAGPGASPTAGSVEITGPDGKKRRVTQAADGTLMVDD